jgi:hypothetical protein
MSQLERLTEQLIKNAPMFAKKLQSHGTLQMWSSKGDLVVVEVVKVKVAVKKYL